LGLQTIKKHQGLEKKVIDELAEAWEGSKQTTHKRHRLLLGPSLVNFKKKNTMIIQTHIFATIV